MKKPWPVIGIVLLVALGAGVAAEGAALAWVNQQHRSEVEALKAEIAEVGTRVSAAQAEAESLRGDLVQSQTRLVQSQGRLANATTALTRADANVKRLRRAYDGLYSDYRRLSTLAAILGGSQGYHYQSSYNPISCTTNTIGSYTYTSCY